MPGKHHYAFVDLVNRQEGQEAIRALDGTDWAGSPIKVREAKQLQRDNRSRGTRFDSSNTPQ
jgi:RNA recognition motif-containing protein